MKTIDEPGMSGLWDEPRTERRLRATATTTVYLIGGGASQAHRFEELADRWSTETAGVSSSHDLILHPAYQGIMAMGPDVVPLILERLQNHRERWFWALRHLTGADPAPSGATSREQAEAWLEWGRDRGLLVNAARTAA